MQSKTQKKNLPPVANKKKFKCVGFGDCQMAFTRQEHLARHQRRHTGEKPFQCEVCMKFFSRFDNMKQHRDAVHFTKRNGNLQQYYIDQNVAAVAAQQQQQQQQVPLVPTPLSTSSSSSSIVSKPTIITTTAFNPNLNHYLTGTPAIAPPQPPMLAQQQYLQHPQPLPLLQKPQHLQQQVAKQLPVTQISIDRHNGTTSPLSMMSTSPHSQVKLPPILLNPTPPSTLSVPVASNVPAIHPTPVAVDENISMPPISYYRPKSPAERIINGASTTSLNAISSRAALNGIANAPQGLSPKVRLPTLLPTTLGSFEATPRSN